MWSKWRLGFRPCCFNALVIRQMVWSDIDMDTKEWRPYVSKTDFTTSYRYQRMSDGTVITALKALGYDSGVMTARGFRTTVSTLLNEQGWSPDAIERQLAHAPQDNVRAAYNRAQYIDEHRRMMQSWADYLDGLKAGADIIHFKKRG